MKIIVIKSVSEKKSRSHQTSKIVKSKQSYNNGHLPYHCSFYYLARASMYDVACEFACAVRMHRNNLREHLCFNAIQATQSDIPYMLIRIPSILNFCVTCFSHLLVIKVKDMKSFKILMFSVLFYLAVAGEYCSNCLDS